MKIKDCDINQIIVEYNRGETLRPLGEKYHVSWMTICRLLHKHDIVMRHNYRHKLPDSPTRICSHCKETKDINKFVRTMKDRQGRAYICRKCHRERGRLIFKTGVPNATERDFIRLKIKQNNVCAICGKGETTAKTGYVYRLSIDHDHSTGAIRGLLCRKCNNGLGMFNDNIPIMKKAIEYLTVWDVNKYIQPKL